MRSAILLCFSFVVGALAGVTPHFPHLLVPVYQDRPTKALETQKTVDISQSGGAHQIFTEVLFDVEHHHGYACKIQFDLEGKQGPEPAGQWTIQGGDGVSFNVSALKENEIPKQNQDTWYNRPAVDYWVATITIYTNGTYEIKGGDVKCPLSPPQGERRPISFLLTPFDGKDMSVHWFELDYPKTGITMNLYEMDFD